MPIQRFSGSIVATSFLLLVAGVATIGCGSDGSTVDIGSADGSADGSGTIDGANGQGDGSLTGDGSPTGDGAARSEGGICAAFGASCSASAQCCSSRCDPTSKTCLSSTTTCTPAANSCTTNTDCCTGSCVNGSCGQTQCLSDGTSCPVAGNTCCSAECTNGKCAALNTSCKTSGNSCMMSGECCSGLCHNGTCALGASYCTQTGDICFHANDCCGGICNAANKQPVTASNPGVCSQPSSGAVNCTGVDGSLCPGGNCGSCCSRLCAPFGPTGVNICQPAQGCRVEGDLCRTNVDCCGASGSGVLGAGAVVCSTSVNGGSVGVCLTPGPTTAGGTCVPEGDVCHYTASNYTCGVSSARADCCGPQQPKFLACVLDPFGVPRCNAYTGPKDDAGVGCVAAAGACSTASECCGGNPCVLDASGKLTCSATACESAGQACTTNADCCSGLPCVAPPGSIQGTCAAILPPPSTTDAGAPAADSGISSDGGYTCALYGQSCSALPCCSGTSCISGKCSTF